MRTIVNTKLSENKGSPRIWLQGTKLVKGRFKEGSLYNRKICREKRRVVFQVSDAGEYKVSGKARSGSRIPVIDVQSSKLSDAFEPGIRLKVMIGYGCIVVTIHHSELRKQKRMDRMFDRLISKAPLEIAGINVQVELRKLWRGTSLFSVPEKVVFAIDGDIDRLIEDFMDHRLLNPDSGPVDNPLAFVGTAPEDLRTSVSEVEVDAVIANLDRQGAECDCEIDAGVFFSSIDAISKLNPSVITLEMSSSIEGSASLAALESILASLGYDLISGVITDARVSTGSRFVMIGVSAGPWVEAGHLDALFEQFKAEGRPSDLFSQAAEQKHRVKAQAAGFFREACSRVAEMLTAYASSSIPALKH